MAARITQFKQKQDDSDTNNYRIPASDTKGHSVRSQFRCQPGMMEMVSSVVGSKIFPYRNAGDLIRHAITRHVKWLKEQEPKIGCSVIGQVDAINAVMRDDEMNQDFQLIFDKMNERIVAHTTSGDHGQARRLLIQIQSHISEMPEGFWKDKYIGELDRRFGHMINNGVSLSRLED